MNKTTSLIMGSFAMIIIGFIFFYGFQFIPSWISTKFIVVFGVTIIVLCTYFLLFKPFFE
jgi:hypothetical protein